MINYVYQIAKLTTSQIIDGRPDTITGAHLYLTATDDTDGISISGTVYVSIFPGDKFISFNELTQEEVESWINSSDIMARYKSEFASMILSKRNPQVLDKSPPWIVAAPIPEPTYQDLRATAYPRIAEQLDMIWHAMDTGELSIASDFYNTLKSVKDTYPKPV